MFNVSVLRQDEMVGILCTARKHQEICPWFSIHSLKELLSGPQGQAFHRTTEYTVCMPNGGWPSAGQVHRQRPGCLSASFLQGPTTPSSRTSTPKSWNETRCCGCYFISCGCISNDLLLIWYMYQLYIKDTGF